MKTACLQFVFAALIAVAVAECPNACSAHGTCGPFDTCTCYRNWMSNDCSERICQFGLAHVDIPKGDLDASGGKLTGPGVTVVENSDLYPYGTQEQFPSFVDTQNNVLTNTAHGYAECSNKGICNRVLGVCNCYLGYEGSACQRQSCPVNSLGVCSGNGVCESISLLAKRDHDNVYKLWDEDVTMGCACDGGYTGPDCSMRICKYGVDPLYNDESQTIRYSNFTYQIYTQTVTNVIGNYTIWFEDHTGEDWFTGPIDIGASCTDVIKALESIPNSVIPSGSVRCYKHQQPYGATFAADADPIDAAQTYIYTGGASHATAAPNGFFTLAFSGNPGYLKQIRINKYLDGYRPTLFTTESSSTLRWYIYANGFTGEDVDYVSDLCVGVTVQLLVAGGFHYFTGLSTHETKLLKECLGDSNGDPSINTENGDISWDYGTETKVVYKQASVGSVAATDIVMNFPNPHLVKLIPADFDQGSAGLESFDSDSELYPFPKSVLCTAAYDKIAVASYGYGWCAEKSPPGFYAVIFWNSTSNTFAIFNRIGTDFPLTDLHVYTTTGYLNRVSPVVVGINELTSSYQSPDSSVVHSSSYHTNNFYTQNITYVSKAYFGAIDCESNPIETGYYANDCLNKDDIVFFFNIALTPVSLANNPIYLNMYRVKKIGIAAPVFGDEQSMVHRNQVTLDFGVNAHYTYQNQLYGVAVNDFSTNMQYAAQIYKFHPPVNGGARYVEQCSGRGICDTDFGLCNCFDGFTGDACSIQNSLAI